MYVTRSLSHCRNNPESLSLPPEGPNSGVLVIQDEESEIYSCFGMWKSQDLKGFPFPQNKNLTIRYSTNLGQYSQTYYNDVSLFPVLNQPLSSNRYYVIVPNGNYKGMAYACSGEEDMTTCCFCRHVKDAKPRPFDPHDTVQHFEIANYISRSRFYAKSVAPNAFPPTFLRRKGWSMQAKTPRNYILSEALGLDTAIRAGLPDLSFPLFRKSSRAVVIGKWYCPFMFIKDGTLTARDQMANSIFYEMTLEQRWEQIFECDNINHGSVAMVDAVVQTEIVLVGGREAVWDEKNVIDRTIWFKTSGSRGEEVSVGLSLEIAERMKWEEARVGWVGGDEREVRVSRVEEFEGGTEGWKMFGCYVLVERFVLKRMDGSLVMIYDFKHTHQLKCTWE